MLKLVRFIVGILFIFSGLVKANDPLGLSYKMQEFFDVWGIGFLNDYTLIFSLLMNGFEIVAGVAVIIGWRMRTFSWLLLLLIIFFTFLTGYALLSGKIKTCGCFGDCLPISPLGSFIKDIVLLLLIIYIFAYRKTIQPAFSGGANSFVILITVLFCVGLQWYVLRHLPIVDCLPYKEGNNLVEQMKAPEGSLPDSFSISFKYLKDGKEVEFDAESFPEDFNDSSYQFVDRYQKLIRKATGQAAIIDFTLYSPAGTDTTMAILAQPNYYVMLMMKDANTAGKDWARRAVAVANQAAQKGIPFFIVTATADAARSQLFGAENINYLRGDATVIKTAARVNPTYFIMKGPTVISKYANVDHEAVIEELNELK